MSDLAVLIVEDDPLTASAYEVYLRRIPGVRLELLATSAEQARRFIASRLHSQHSVGIDLMLVDMNLPDGHGLDILRQLRAIGWMGGAIALTAAAERDVVRGSLALGVTQYLLKPFTFSEFADAITTFKELNARVGRSGNVADQESIDAIFGAPQPRSLELPKGLTVPTLALVRTALNESKEAVSASELGAVVQLSRVTARRYLEHLVATGQAERGSRHGTMGRPEVEYSPRR